MNGCGRGGLALFGLLVMLAGGCGAWQVDSDWRNSRISRYWPSVSGVIVATGTSSRQSGAGYDFLVQYRYTVRGHDYTGTRADWSTIGKSKRDMNWLLGRLATGRTARVFYDPHHPQQSCLFPDSFDSNSVWTFPFFSFLFCFGLGCFVLCCATATPFSVFSNACAEE